MELTELVSNEQYRVNEQEMTATDSNGHTVEIKKLSVGIVIEAVQKSGSNYNNGLSFDDFDEYMEEFADTFFIVDNDQKIYWELG